MGIQSGHIHPLGATYNFGEGNLYVGGYLITGTDAPDWSRVEVQYVREGELHYQKIPTEVGFKSVGGSTAASDLVIPHIMQEQIGTGVYEYVVQEQRTKRRELVLTITANVATVDINESALADFAAYQNRLVDIGVGPEKWLFESISWVELSDRVTQATAVFRGTDTRPELDPGSPGAVGDIYIPPLPPFNKYVVVPGASGGPPTIVAVPEYDTLTDNPMFFSWFLPVFA